MIFSLKLEILEGSLLEMLRCDLESSKENEENE
jgi:hypothetical protein